MKVQRVTITKRPSKASNPLRSIANGFLQTTRAVLPLFGATIPFAVFITLHFWGLPGLLVENSRHMCVYVDFSGQYIARYEFKACPYVGFRKIDLIPFGNQ